MNSQKAYIDSPNYQFVMRTYQEIVKMEEWKQNFVHLVEQEPLQILTWEDTDKGISIEIQGNWRDYCHLVDKAEQAYPYLKINTYSVERKPMGLSIKAQIFA